MKLITAGPGAGKTQRLVSDIKERLYEGVSPFMILATTFTREAAKEIEGRLGGEVPIRTIHGLAYWLVRLSRRARGAVVPRIVSEDGSLALMERAMKELDITFVEPRKAVEDMARIREVGGEIETLHPQVVQMIERYFNIMSSENLMDFTGILEEAKQELSSEELRKFLEGQHVFVDEGQDVSPVTEWPVLDALREGSNEFVMFASPSQQIYGFRGADWEKLRSGFPRDLQVETIQENYRSTPEIIAAASPLAGVDASDMLPVRGSKGIPVLLVDAINPEMEFDYVGRQINEWLNEGVEANQIAILARVHTTLNSVQRALRTRNIPFQMVGGKTSIFHREETQAVLGYLRLALDPMDDTILETIINFPPCGIGVSTRHSLRGDSYLTWDHIFKALSDPLKFRDQVIERIYRVLDLREYLEEVARSSSSLIEIVRRVLELSSIPTYLNSEGDFQSMRAINDLVQASLEYGDLRQYVEYLESETRKPRDADGIQLSTIHSSKGREFEAVIIPGFQDGLLPLEGSDLREERNLAFVGMTRAKNNLVLTMNRAFPPSSFLGKLPVHVAQWPLR